MSNLLEGKLALILGIANKWSLAYAIAQAFWREGATLALTYLGDRQKVAIEELSQGLPVAGLWPCDVTKEEDLLALTESLRALGRPLDAVVHSLAFANRDDLSRPFVETGRAGFPLAPERSGGDPSRPSSGVGSLPARARPLDAVVHSLAFANRDDLSRPFVETGRAGFLLAQEVSSYSLVAVAPATTPIMTAGGALMTLTHLPSPPRVPNHNTIGVA